MAGEASSRSPRIDDLSREQVGSSPTKLTSFHRWLRVWKQIVIAEVLRVLEPRRTD